MFFDNYNPSGVRYIVSDIDDTFISFSKLDEDGKRKWTFVKATKKLDLDGLPHINAVYKYKGYDPSHEGRLLAFWEVLKAIVFLTIPMWDNQWRDKVDALWRGETVHVVHYRYSEAKQIDEKKASKIFETFLATEHRNHAYHLFDGHNNPIKKQELFFTQLFGPGSFALAIMIQSHLKIQFENSQQDDVKIMGKMLILLQQCPKEHQEPFILAIKSLNTFKPQDIFNNFDVLKQCIEVRKRAIEKFVLDAKQLALLESINLVFEKAEEESTTQLALDELSRIKEDDLFANHIEKVSKYLDKLPRNERVACVKAVNSAYPYTKETHKKSFRWECLPLLVGISSHEKELFAKQLAEMGRFIPYFFSNKIPSDQRILFLKIITPFMNSLEKKQSEHFIAKELEKLNQLNPEGQAFFQKYGSKIGPALISEHCYNLLKLESFMEVLKDIFPKDQISQEENDKSTLVALAILELCETKCEYSDITDLAKYLKKFSKCQEDAIKLYKKILGKTSAPPSDLIYYLRHIEQKQIKPLIQFFESIATYPLSVSDRTDIFELAYNRNDLDNIKFCIFALKELGVALSELKNLTPIFSLFPSNKEKFEKILSTAKEFILLNVTDSNKIRIIRSICLMSESEEGIKKIEIVRSLMANETYRFLKNELASLLSSCVDYKLKDLSSILEDGMPFLVANQALIDKFMDSTIEPYTSFLNALGTTSKDKALVVIEMLKDIFKLENLSEKNFHANGSLFKLLVKSLKYIKLAEWKDSFEAAKLCFNIDLPLVSFATLVKGLSVLQEKEKIRVASLWNLISVGFQNDRLNESAEITRNIREFNAFVTYIGSHGTEVDAELKELIPLVQQWTILPNMKRDERLNFFVALTEIESSDHYDVFRLLPWLNLTVGNIWLGGYLKENFDAIIVAGTFIQELKAQFSDNEREVRKNEILANTKAFLIKLTGEENFYSLNNASIRMNFLLCVSRISGKKRRDEVFACINLAVKKLGIQENDKKLDFALKSMPKIALIPFEEYESLFDFAILFKSKYIEPWMYNQLAIECEKISESQRNYIHHILSEVFQNIYEPTLEELITMISFIGTIQNHNSEISLSSDVLKELLKTYLNYSVYVTIQQERLERAKSIDVLV